MFLDENGNGVYDPGEGLVAGVTVELLDATGGVVATEVTDAAGFYCFVGLDAGTYRVRFVEPDGFDFTTEGAAADDAVNNDSDADILSGLTDTFVLSIGESEKDIDAGLVVENGDPEPQDDSAKLCADEVVTVDVLANDGDPDGDPLTMVSVDGKAISEGATVTTAAGTFVTLVGGLLVIDGEAAYAALDIGEEAIETISYAVSDGNGGIVSANLEVTFCGDANSVLSLCESLPAGVVTYQVSTTDLVRPVEDAAYGLLFNSTGDARFDGVLFEQAYCLSRNDPTQTSETITDAPVQSARMYCASEADPSLFGPQQVSVFNGQTAFANLDLITWILNQDFENNGFTGWEVQRAIWELTDDDDLAFLDGIDPGFGSDSNVDSILALAAANGENFVAGVGDVIGVIVDPGDSDPDNTQPFILAMDFEDYDCLC